MMTLEELKATAPRSFDKLLIDLLVKVQAGGKPIVTQATPIEVVREVKQTYDDTALRAQIMALEGRPPEIPDEIRELILEMADQIKNLNIKLHSVQGELDAMKALEIVDTRSIRGVA